MVDCNEVLREVELYLDGELPEEQSRVIAEHLVTCWPCQEGRTSARPSRP